MELKDFNEGDLVRATDGENMITTRVVAHPDGTLCINPMDDKDPDVWRFISWYHNSVSRKLELVEKVKPKLPTVPGSVVRFKNEFAVWQLWSNGLWSNTVGGTSREWTSAQLLSIRGHEFHVLEVRE